MKRSENGLVPVSTQAEALFRAVQVEGNATQRSKRAWLETSIVPLADIPS